MWVSWALRATARVGVRNCYRNCYSKLLLAGESSHHVSIQDLTPDFSARVGVRDCSVRNCSAKVGVRDCFRDCSYGRQLASTVLPSPSDNGAILARIFLKSGCPVLFWCCSVLFVRCCFSQPKGKISNGCRGDITALG